MTNEITRPTEESATLVVELAADAGLDSRRYFETVKQLCGCGGAKNEHFYGLLMQARRLGLDPILRQLYLMATQRGVQVVIPVDGYLTLMRKHPDYLSHTCEMGADDVGGQFAEAVIYTKSQHKAGTPPFRHREYMRECRKDTGPWKSHPLRMLQHKAMSQAVRYAFAVYAPDEDEFGRPVDPGDVEEVRPVLDARPAVPIAALQDTAMPFEQDTMTHEPTGEPMSEDEFRAEMDGAAPETPGGELFS